MKTLILLAGLALSVPALAQQNNAPAPQSTQQQGQRPERTPEQRANMVAKRMVKTLGINADQEKKVYDIALVRARKVDDFKGKDQGNKAQLKSDLQAARAEFETSLQGILTPEQFQKWKANQAGNKEGGQEK